MSYINLDFVHACGFAGRCSPSLTEWPIHLELAWVDCYVSPGMRVVLQRVSEASVSVEGKCVGEIRRGVLLFLGIEKADFADSDDADGAAHIDWLVRKVVGQRLFPDADDRMNLSLLDVGGEALVISQFTLHARTKKGTRPSFDQAAPPADAQPRYEAFVAALSAALGKPVATGKFGAMMDVALVNDGPVTLILDSQRRE